MDRPTIFSTPMVRALLAGVKTQTRRLATSPLTKCRQGDRLWVRENFWQAHSYPGTLPSGEPEPTSWTRGRLLHYSADGNPPNVPNRHYHDGLHGGMFAAPDPYAVWLQRPSIHMPRWASRLTLVVTEVRHQRLQDITDGDAIAEGIIGDRMLWGQADAWRPNTSGTPCCDIVFAANSPVGAYYLLWEHLHGKGSWDANPEVVALTFSVHRENIDQMPTAVAAE